MSLPFSSFGGASASFCQRCQNSLPPNIVQCAYCGYDNSPVQHHDLAGNIPHSSHTSQSSWNVYPHQNGTIGEEYDRSQWNPQSQQLPFPKPSLPIPHTPEISQPVMGERRPLNMKKVVSLVVVLLVLIGASAAGYTVLTSQQGGKHTTSIASSSPIPKESPLFAETFTNNRQQWDMQSIQGRYLVSINKGKLILEDDDNKLFPILLPGGKNLTNFKLVIDTMLSKGDRQNGYGLCIRGSTDPDGNLTAYYRIELYGNSTYAIFKVATDANGNSSSTTLVETTAHVAIEPMGRSNQIVVIANGPKITLIVNGQTVETFSDTSYVSGVIALFVSNLPGTHPGAQAMFSHLTIYPINAK